MMLRPKVEQNPRILTLDETESFVHDNMISFEEIYQNYCVGIVDVVDSTKIISKLSQDKACIYYSVFLNTIGYIAQSHGAKVDRENSRVFFISHYLMGSHQFAATPRMMF